MTDFDPLQIAQYSYMYLLFEFGTSETISEIRGLVQDCSNSSALAMELLHHLQASTTHLKIEHE